MAKVCKCNRRNNRSLCQIMRAKSQRYNKAQERRLNNQVRSHLRKSWPVTSDH